MKRSRYFRVGSKVIAYSLLTKDRIVGIYRRTRGSFGAVVCGRPEGSLIADAEHICSKLTMQIYNPPKPFGSLSQDKLKIKAGDHVQASTTMGLVIKGSYMNRDGKFAWIKGHKEGESRLEAPQAYRVLSGTLIKLDSLSNKS